MRTKTELRVAALLLAGCACVATPGSTGRQQNEALGLVESSAPSWSASQAWRVDATPAVVIGNDQGPEPYLLYRVQTALLLPGNGVVVASAGSYDLRYFAADGTHLRTVGGRGQGPGEFQWPRWMGRIAGDDVLVWDGPNSRIHVFTAGGDLVRTTMIDPTIPPEMTGELDFPGRPRLVGAFPDGTLVVEPAFPTAYITARSNGTHRLRAALVTYGPEGGAQGPVAHIDGEEHTVHDGSSMHLPFGHRFLVAVGNDRIFTGSGKPYEIRLLARDGGEIGLIRKVQEPREIAATHRQEFRKRLLARIVSSSRATVEAELDAIEFPAGFPDYDRLLVDSTGNLWARDYEWPRDDDDPMTWSVFDRNGVWLGSVETPAGVEVTDIGAARIVGISIDDAGVEHVVVHELIKP